MMFLLYVHLNKLLQLLREASIFSCAPTYHNFVISVSIHKVKGTYFLLCVFLRRFTCMFLYIPCLMAFSNRIFSSCLTIELTAFSKFSFRFFPHSLPDS